MTSEDGESISEDEMDEIVSRVVDELRDAGVGQEADDGEPAPDEEPDEHDIEVRVEDDGNDERDGSVADEPREDAERRRDAARQRGRKAKRRARERERQAREGANAFEDLGDRIEAAVESQLAHVADHIEQSIPGTPAPSPGPGVVVGPDDAREKAVYKTQLQKGGRVAVPDTEMEALGLDPGDTLQVVLYPVE